MKGRKDSEPRSSPPGARRLPAPGILLCLLLLLGAAPFGGDLPAANPSPDNRAALARRAASWITPGSSHARREKAVSLLAGLGDAASREVDALARSPEVFRRLAAVRALSGPGFGPKAERLIPFLKDRGFAVREAALEGIRNTFMYALPESAVREPPGADPRTVNAVLPLLADPFWPVRRAAVIALAASRSARAAGPILEAAADPEPEVRRAALAFMGEIAGDLTRAKLARTAGGLTAAERALFFKNALPLARPENAAFFRRAARELGDSPAGLAALECAVAAGDESARKEVLGVRLPRLVGVSLGEDEDASTEADTLLGWAASRDAERFARVLEAALDSGRHDPGHVVFILRSALGAGAIPFLEKWTARHLDDPRLAEPCVANLNIDMAPEGSAAIARLLPRLEGTLRRRAVSVAALVLDHAPSADLAAALVPAALEDPPEVAAKAYGALCRLQDLSPGIAARLIDRFRKEKDPAARRTFLRLLTGAGRGRNRAAVAKALIDEIAEKGPAAASAGAVLPGIAQGKEIPRGAAALEELYASLAAPADKETVLAALSRLSAPGTDAFVAHGAEALLKSAGPAAVGRLVTALGACGGPLTAGFLKTAARSGDPSLEKRAVRSLVARRDPEAIDLAEKLFPRLKSTAKSSLLDSLAAAGLGKEAAGFLEGTVMAEQEGGVLAAAIDALDGRSAQRIEARLLDIVSSPSGFGAAAAEAGIRALSRSRKPEALYTIKERLKTYVKEGRRAPQTYFDMADDRTVLALAASRALAELADPEGPGILAGLLFQSARAQRDERILAAWRDVVRGTETSTDHTFTRNVLESLLLYPDKRIEEAVLGELDRLGESGDLFLMGDAAFGVVFRELLARGRCPALRKRLEDLVFRCRPDLSPAEFRVCVLMGDRAAAAGRPARAARNYLRAFFIARYNPPSRRVVRTVLRDPDPFTGYDPAASLYSEALSRLADDLESKGRTAEAARLAAAARRRSPFRRTFSGPPSGKEKKAGQRENKKGKRK